MMLRLEILALSGNSPVSNAFTEEADRMGLTVKGRERKEREEQRKFAAAMDALRQRAAEFQNKLGLLEQATAEALRENEEQMAAAREEMRRIREQAYEITMPDGKAAKVYRDGDKVRTESGAEVAPDIVRAEDIGEGRATWQDFQAADARLRELAAERERIVSFQNKIETARKASGGSGISADELDALEAGIDSSMPATVRKRLEAAGPPVRDAAQAPEGRLTAPFRNAAGPGADTDDFPPNDPSSTRRPQAASPPAPR